MKEIDVEQQHLNNAKTKKDDFVITPADVKLTGIDYSDFYAKHLREHPEELKWYKKQSVKDYNETKDLDMFLANLETIAKAQGKKKSVKILKTKSYKATTQDYVPAINNFLALANNVGIDFVACWVK
jgi:hypothetical protein